jgi:hypothetical protein
LQPCSDAVARIFEQELARRGEAFRFDDESQRYVIQHQGLNVFLSLDNLAREYARDPDDARVTRFINLALGGPPRTPDSWEEARKSVLFCLEPSITSSRRLSVRPSRSAWIACWFTSPGVVIAYSTQAGEVAEAGDRGNGPFAKALPACLRTPGPRRAGAAHHCPDDVLAATGGQQTPFVYGSLTGKEYFFVAVKWGRLKSG